ncbi:MAG: hypothetical protein GX994_05580 [Firmicutes bacterium]|nr:hypothetical protein [Bacillota bacterium]
MVVLILLSGNVQVHAFSSNDMELIKEFNLDMVEITDPYYLNAFEKDVKYLLSLNPDRLLVGFQAVSDGIDPGKVSLFLRYGVNLYGGWEGGWSLLRGHTMGHYLTALAQAYEQTKINNSTLNLQIKDKIDYTISKLKQYQDASTNGYLFASPEIHFDIIEGKASGDTWVPWYTMHKIMTGLLNVYKYAENETALEIASRLGDWAYDRSSTWNASIHRRVLNIEYGGMNDVLYELYKYTNDTQHLTAAHKFDDESMFGSLARGANVLLNQHANTQIPKFIGALNRYLTLGAEEKFYFDVAERFWTVVVNYHTYVTGGNSENERFRRPDQLDFYRNNLNNESCNAYNMLKLTRELFRVTGDVKYADFYERLFINEIMASQNPVTGMTTYFKPMGTGYFKAYGTPTESFWCCTGTGMENFTKLDDSIYFHVDSDLYINLYLSSTLNWEDKGLFLIQAADIPNSDKVSFTIAAAPEDELNIKFRIPSWVAESQSVSIVVNDETVHVEEERGYFGISRVWCAGDIVELTLPMEVKVSRLPDNQDAVAFTYGPVVLSAALGTEKMIVSGHMASVKPTMPDDVNIKDYIIIQNGSIDDWINNITSNLIRTPGKLEFTLQNTDEDENLIFTPYYMEYKNRYGIYFRLAALDSLEYQNIILDRKNRNKIENATIDEVQVTNDQHGLVHNLRGNSSGGSFGGYNYRHAHGTRDGEGWFSYDMKIDPLETNYVSVKYYSGDAGRTFNIYVDDQLLKAETVRSQNPTGFYDVLYEIPAEWVEGKSKVTIKFANRGSSYVGGVFDRISILKGYNSNTELESIIVDGVEAQLANDTYFVGEHVTEVGVNISPVDKNALVYVDGILIDDTVPRIVTINSELISMNVKVVAEDGKTTKDYVINLSCSISH